MRLFSTLRQRARELKIELIALALAARHPARSREIEARAPRLSRAGWLVIVAAWVTAVVLIALWSMP